VGSSVRPFITQDIWQVLTNYKNGNRIKFQFIGLPLLLILQVKGGGVQKNNTNSKDRIVEKPNKEDDFEKVYSRS